MTEKDMTVLIKAAEKKQRIGLLTLLIGLTVGVGLFGYHIGVETSFASLKDVDHLTDDGIAVRDIDNGTYTFDGDYLDDRMDMSWIPYALGLGILVSAWLINHMAPSDKSIHESYCDGSAKKRFCAECGVRLSKLKKKDDD